ncbi:MAG: CcmD family protein [Candidatus Kapabacteria bacterium]|nr:CcmD family protein [Candidatus Kapabacteria bacterium]
MYHFLVENSVYVVLIIVLIIWTGISLFLFNLDKKITNLENIVNKNNVGGLE